MPRIALVTFDLDNTLWDVDGVIVAAERETKAWFDERVPEVNRLLSRDDFQRLRGQAIADDARLAHDVSSLRRETFRRAIRAAGYGDTEARRLADEGFDVFLHARHRVEFFDGALDVLEVLRGRYRLAALTNGNADIARLGLDRYFGFALSAASVGASKPHPAMFREALRRAASDPHEMVHVGDHPIDDVQGAADVGVHTIWVNLKGIPFPGTTPASREARTLAAIPDAIDAIDRP
jgi:putative hydrolase of the HAD superfamily